MVSSLAMRLTKRHPSFQQPLGGAAVDRRRGFFGANRWRRINPSGPKRGRGIEHDNVARRSWLACQEPADEIRTFGGAADPQRVLGSGG